ncbi:hypothetical protein [Sodalis sp. dw_96]|nr:hypothetical protein [Sodalis sp. dw_96]
MASGQPEAAFTECQVDGTLVGLPLIFTGSRPGWCCSGNGQWVLEER